MSERLDLTLRGRLRIPDEWVRDWFRLRGPFGAFFFPYRVEHDFGSQLFTYDCYSVLFRQVEAGAYPPAYTVIVEEMSLEDDNENDWLTLRVVEIPDGEFRPYYVWLRPGDSYDDATGAIRYRPAEQAAETPVEPADAGPDR